MESPVFEGHFPGHPLVPGVLLTETMAQASGYLVLGLMDFTHMPFLMAVDKARFRTFVGPGTVLDRHGRSWSMRARATPSPRPRSLAEGKPICDAELRFRIMPFPDGMDGQMRAQARRIGLLAESCLMRDVVITGIGLVSSAGEGLEAHLAALASGSAPKTDREHLRTLYGPSGRLAGMGPADPEEIRSAPDGGLAEARLLRGGPRPRCRRAPRTMRT